LLSSPDGSTWTSSRLERGAVIYDIVAGPSRWVAVGSFGDARIEATGGAAWSSSDGQTWQRTELYRDADDPTGNSWGTNVTDVVAGGPGFVAVRQNLQTWNSSDGVTWTRGGDLPFGDPESIYRLELLALEERLLVIGEGGEVWSSLDGVAWTMVHQNNFGLDIQLPLKTAWTSGLGVVAYGMPYGDPCCDRPRLVMSPDGMSWTTLEAPPNIRTVGPFGDNGIIAGQHSVWPPMTPDLSGVEVWIWTPPD